MKARGQTAKFGLALTCAFIFWSLGSGLSWAQDTEQGIFQAYTKPQVPPDFSLENVQGKKVDVRDYRGQVILLNFWSTWCPKCRKEGPSLEKFYAQYQSKGLIFYRIVSKESQEVVQKFLEKESLHFPVLLDKTGKVERLFGIWVHPTSYLINRQAVVSYRIMGVFDWTSPQATGIIDQLLKER